jgi:hypothetical protein
MGWVLDGDAGMEAPQPGGLGGTLLQFEPGLFGSLTALPAVAGDAAGDDVGPFGLAAQRPWNNMIVGEPLGRFPPPAILALEPIPGIDILPGKLDFPLAQADITHQPNDGRNSNRAGDGVNLALGLFDHLDFLEENKLDRPLPVDDIERLERRI